MKGRPSTDKNIVRATIKELKLRNRFLERKWTEAEKHIADTLIERNEAHNEVERLRTDRDYWVRHAAEDYHCLHAKVRLEREGERLKMSLPQLVDEWGLCTACDATAFSCWHATCCDGCEHPIRERGAVE